MKNTFIYLAMIGATTVACNKKGCTDPYANNYVESATKEDGSCTYDNFDEGLEAPNTYTFTDADGNNTVSYSGQTDRLNHLREMVQVMDLALDQSINGATLKDMFANVGDNGNGNFTFTSTKQLKNKCFSLDQDLFEAWMDSIADVSQYFADTAEAGKAGLIYSGTSRYLVSAEGIEYKQLLEKGLMGAVFMNQALNVYFGSDKMIVDNTTAVDPSAGKYYTTMEHHYDEAFGYFGVPVDFPTTIPSDFWGKYCNSRDAILGSNTVMMDNFLVGRIAIVNEAYTLRDAAIENIRLMWEEVSAYQAIKYLEDAVGYFGNDDAKYLHALSEAYAFAWNLRYTPESTRRVSVAQHADIMALFGTDFWELTVADLNNIKNEILAKY